MAAAIADDTDLSEQAAVAIRVVGDVFFLGGDMSVAVLLAAGGVPEVVATASIVFTQSGSSGGWGSRLGERGEAARLTSDTCV